MDNSNHLAPKERKRIHREEEGFTTLEGNNESIHNVMDGSTKFLYLPRGGGGGGGANLKAPNPLPVKSEVGAFFLIALLPPSLIEIVSPSLREKSREPPGGRWGEAAGEFDEEEEEFEDSFGGDCRFDQSLLLERSQLL